MTDHLTAEEVCHVMMICDCAPPERKSRYMKDARELAAWMENPTFSYPHLDYPPLQYIMPSDVKAKPPVAAEPPPPPPPPAASAPVRKNVRNVVDFDDLFSF